MPSRISCSVHHSMWPLRRSRDLQREEPVGGRPDRERPRDRVGLHGGDVVGPVEERLCDRPTPLGLGAGHAVGLLLDRADRDQLPEGPVDLREQRPARDRHHHVVGKPPAQLLRGLEAERLRPLGIVRAHVHVHERPRQRVGDLAAEAVHLVVVAPDRHDLRAVRLGREDLRALEVVGHEHVALDAGLRGVGGRGVREVPGRGARDRLVAERARHRRCDAHDPILERIRRVHRVVLDPDHAVVTDRLGEVVGLAKRGEPGAEVDALDARPAGEQRLVAPEGLRTRFRLLAEVDPVDRLQVVGGLERPEALLADRERLDRILLAADAALQRGRRGDGESRGHHVTAP